MFSLVRGPELADALEPYLAVDRTRPAGAAWVLGHMVAGLDGTAAIGGRVGALSTGPDKILFRRMRQLADVVLVAAETVRREGYGTLGLDEVAQRDRTARGMRPSPPLAVLSRSLNLNWSSKAFTSAPEDARTIVVTCAAADPGRRAEAAQVADVVLAGEDKVEPALALQALADLGHRVVVCEGGPTWLGQLAAAGYLDELCLSIAPLMGGDPLPVAITPEGGGLTGYVLKHVLEEDSTLLLRYEAAPADSARDGR